MDSCGKRLGIALTTVVLVLGLNALAVVSGVADHAYGRLLGAEPGVRVADAAARPVRPGLIAKAAECAGRYPKPVSGDGMSLAVSSARRSDILTRIC
ncbi:MAG: hypothetical protein PVG38_07780 [Gammaproteobacteria bacterium]|jgi:hypothetical protein